MVNLAKHHWLPCFFGFGLLFFMAVEYTLFMVPASSPPFDLGFIATRRLHGLLSSWPELNTVLAALNTLVVFGILTSDFNIYAIDHLRTLSLLTQEFLGSGADFPVGNVSFFLFYSGHVAGSVIASLDMRRMQSLEEEGGETFTFEGTGKKCNLEAVLKVHNPQFYWKVMTRADMGLAIAYIDGDFSLADKDQGLLDLFMVLIANRDANKSISKVSKNRGWWTPSFFTAIIASAKFFLQHVLRQNTLTQARRNMSHSYDLGNEFFSLFLGETMAYSTAIFKTEDEDLNTAQLRKINALIEKARIDKKHEILEIGCGWGTFAIEAVKQTGCKYTGLTLSVEQLKYAEMKVKEAGMQDNIRLLLCDYRELPKGYKYDRIVSCEMIEHVGHEYMEEYFSICESALAEDGLLVLQFISIADECYDENRRSSDFIKEYIFPGVCLPSLSRITSAMNVASRLSVEHVENLGSHYYFTLRCWRKNFLENKSKILSLGFDEKFIRTWEYFFYYSAAGFKTYTARDYQVVFSCPGNVAALGNPYKGFPSAYQHVSLI